MLEIALCRSVPGSLPESPTVPANSFPTFLKGRVGTKVRCWGKAEMSSSGNSAMSALWKRQEGLP